MNSYRISVLILNLPDFSELAPPYMHQGYIRSHVHPDPGIALWWPGRLGGRLAGADKGVTTCWCSLNDSTALRADGRR
jgi:hypothetical protein